MKFFYYSNILQKIKFSQKFLKRKKYKKKNRENI